MKNVIRICLPLILLVAGFHCRKASDKLPKTSTETLKLEALTRASNVSCPNAPDYGDSIVFSKWKGLLQDFKIKPLNPIGGTYFSMPQGMVINRYTGEINLTRSEKGIRYLVGFVKTGTLDTCFSKLIIAGITYVDSIYVMDQYDTLAIPYYNANPNTPVICNPSNDNDYPDLGFHGDIKCEFDDDADLDGYGLFDQPFILSTLNGLLIRIRTISGVINLRKTLQGAFGLLPINGMKLNVIMYYRLNDGSGRVLQQIPLQFIYYNRESDIPASLKNDVSARRSSFYSAGSDASFMQLGIKPRPPQIIITRYSY